MDTSINIYARKSKRHDWFNIAMCHHDKSEFIRQAYLASIDFKDWQVAWIEEECDTYTYPENKKSNFKGMHIFNPIDLATAQKLWDFVQCNIPINQDVVAAGVELGLMEITWIDGNCLLTIDKKRV